MVLCVAMFAALPAIAVAAPKGDKPAKSDNAGPKRDKATGGGQAFFDSREPTGAGDTVAFTAQRARDAADGSSLATGQVQVNRRGAANAVKFHGIVDCLVVNALGDTPAVSKGAGEAYIGGYVRGNPADRFELYVRDGGKGQMERANDVIMLFAPGETTNNDNPDTPGAGPCGFDDPEDPSVTMARGNVQVTNANTSEDEQPPEEQQQGGAEGLAAPLSSLLG